MKSTFLLLVVTGLALPQIVAASDSSCLAIAQNPPPHVDMARVRSVWLSWNNRLRLRLHLKPYTLNPYLDATASNWSAYAVKRRTIDHKRYAGSPYYDYDAIESWFRDKGLEFANVGGKTFTENIGWGPYDCSSGDCTNSLISAIRSTFGFFLAEKAKDGPHYRSLVNDEFKEIGVGISVSPNQDRYYLTVHYATAITNDPLPLCKG